MAQLYKDGLTSLGIIIQNETNVIELLFKKSLKRTEIIKKIAQFFDKQASELDYTNKNICDILKQVIYAPPGALEKFVEGDLVDKEEQKRIWDAIFRNMERMKIQIKRSQDELLVDCCEYLKSEILFNTFPTNLANKIAPFTPDVQIKEENECCHFGQNLIVYEEMYKLKPFFSCTLHVFPVFKDKPLCGELLDNKNDLDTKYLSLSSILENCSKENEFEDDNEKDLEMFRQVSACTEDIEKQIKIYSDLLKK